MPLMSQNSLAAQPHCQLRQIHTHVAPTSTLTALLGSKSCTKQAVQAPLKRRLQPRPLRVTASLLFQLVHLLLDSRPPCCLFKVYRCARRLERYTDVLLSQPNIEIEHET